MRHVELWHVGVARPVAGVAVCQRDVDNRRQESEDVMLVLVMPFVAEKGVGKVRVSTR